MLYGQNILRSLHLYILSHDTVLASIVVWLLEGCTLVILELHARHHYDIATWSRLDRRYDRPVYKNINTEATIRKTVSRGPATQQLGMRDLDNA